MREQSQYSTLSLRQPAWIAMAAVASTASSPQRAGYQIEDLESQGENGTSEDVEESADDTEEASDKVTRMDTADLHPDDSMHKYWYETTVRLRCIFFVFFSLAMVLACALGATTECFFALLATPPSQGLSPGVVIGCVTVPVLLLTSAIYVDECIDMGLDAADRPSFGLFRATVATALKTGISQRVCTDHIEKALMVALEGLPLIFAIVTVVLADAKVYWYKDFSRGYCLGGLLFAMVICLTYIVCHIYVGHNPERDDLMAVTYHNMGPLGRFKRVNKTVEKPSPDNKPHWGRAGLFFLIGLFLEVVVVVLFIFLHDFYSVFIGQLLATIFWALAVKRYAPRLLGKAFWITFVFFIALTVGLLFGTLASASVGHKSGTALEPLARGPLAAGYGEVSAADGKSFNDLPLNFQVTAGSPYSDYPICLAEWRYPGTPKMPGINILDMSLLAYASSFFDEEDVRRGLGEMLNGTHLADWELLEVESPRTVGRWIVVSFPALKLRVVSVRGTSNIQDAYADLKLYSGVAVLQMTSVFTPVLALMPTSVTRVMLSGKVSQAVFQHESVSQRLREAVVRHKEEAAKQGQKLLMTGHSLGGALVGAVSASEEVDGIGFSPPGLYYQVRKFSLRLRELQSFSVVQPENDLVPRVDKQRGMIQWTECKENAAQCHRLTHTACELWVRCGDASKRDWRQTCSKWYHGGPNGDVNQEL